MKIWMTIGNAIRLVVSGALKPENMQRLYFSYPNGSYFADLFLFAFT